MTIRWSSYARVLALAFGVGGCRVQQPGTVPHPAPPSPQAQQPQRTQNPSPMVESARRHERIPPGRPPGITFTIDSVLPRAVEVFIPDRLPVSSVGTEERTLLVHVFSAAYVPMRAVADARDPFVLAVVNLGGSSSAYERALADTAAWSTLLQRVRAETMARTQGRVRVGGVVVSAFSAGYGGVRALLSDERTAATIGGVLLLDGLHTGYIPERTVLSEGGALDTLKLVPFLRYARRAVAGEVRLVVTHSEIFPGTFASTTETADWIIAALGLSRAPVLEWGPGGMQQISEVRRGGLAILGFAGNTGPDHIDHLHGLGGFLQLLSAPSLPATTPSGRSNR